jgi:MFS family permease
MWNDMKRKDLVWVKLIFFLQSAGLVVLYPYLSIHQRSLGFTAEDTALVKAVVSFADILGPPAVGFLADKMGNFKVFMAAVTFLNGAVSLLMLVVPSIEYQTTHRFRKCTKYLLEFTIAITFIDVITCRIDNTCKNVCRK